MGQPQWNDADSDDESEEEELQQIASRAPSMIALRKRGKSLSGKEITKDVHNKLQRLATHVFHGVCVEHRVEDLYDLGQELGKGAFGVVREARDRATGVLFCCKSIPRDVLTDEMFANIQLEAEIMMHLRGHPHVVEIMGLFTDDTHIHIVEELCSGGDLYSTLSQRLVPYTEVQVAAIMRSVLEVVAHCHAMGVMYRDCKPDNFLLSTNGADAVLKATDFGISRFVKPGQKLSEFCGTPTYMAPEVFDVNYGLPADVWSAGVTMYWVISGDFPFKGRNKMELAQRVCRDQPRMSGGVWDQVTPEAKDCLKQMLQKDPSKRPTAAELLQHQWFKDMAGAHVKPLGSIVLQRMRAFMQMHDLKKEVMRYLVGHLADTASLAGLKAQFAAMDLNSNGRLSVEEVATALAAQGVQMDRAELQALLASIDSDQDGVIDFMEFACATMSGSVLENEQLLRRAFAFYDADGDGIISTAELETALRAGGRLSEAQVARIMAQVHKHVGGQVDFAEFCCLMLESEEQGKEGLKLRRRVREAVTAIFSHSKGASRARTSLPNLQPLSRGASMSGGAPATLSPEHGKATLTRGGTFYDMLRSRSRSIVGAVVGPADHTSSPGGPGLGLGLGLASGSGAAAPRGRSVSITGAALGLERAPAKSSSMRRNRRLSVQHLVSEGGEVGEGGEGGKEWSSRTQSGVGDGEPATLSGFLSRFAIFRPLAASISRRTSSNGAVLGREGSLTRGGSNSGPISVQRSQASLNVRGSPNSTTTKASPHSTLTPAMSPCTSIKHPSQSLEQRSPSSRYAHASFASNNGGGFGGGLGHGGPSSNNLMDSGLLLHKDRDSVRSSCLRKSCLVQPQQAPASPPISGPLNTANTLASAASEEVSVSMVSIKRRDKRISWAAADETTAAAAAAAAAAAGAVAGGGSGGSSPQGAAGVCLCPRLSDKEDVEGFIWQLQGGDADGRASKRPGSPAESSCSTTSPVPSPTPRDSGASQAIACASLLRPSPLRAVTGPGSNTKASMGRGASSLHAAAVPEDKPLARVSPFALAQYGQYGKPTSDAHPLPTLPTDHLRLCQLLDVAPAAVSLQPKPGGEPELVMKYSGRSSAARSSVARSSQVTATHASERGSEQLAVPMEAAPCGADAAPAPHHHHHHHHGNSLQQLASSWLLPSLRQRLFASQPGCPPGTPAADHAPAYSSSSRHRLMSAGSPLQAAGSAGGPSHMSVGVSDNGVASPMSTHNASLQEQHSQQSVGGSFLIAASGASPVRGGKHHAVGGLSPQHSPTKPLPSSLVQQDSLSWAQKLKHRLWHPQRSWTEADGSPSTGPASTPSPAAGAAAAAAATPMPDSGAAKPVPHGSGARQQAQPDLSPKPRWWCFAA